MKLLFLKKRPPRHLRDRFHFTFLSRFAANIFRKPLLMIKDIPVLVVQVLDYLSMSIAGFAEDSLGLRRQTFIDLDKTEPLRGQEPLAPSRDCAIEHERVVIGNEQGQCRFIIQHIFPHVLLLRLHDVWRIAEDDIEWINREILLRIEHISLDKFRLQSTCSLDFRGKILT